MNISILANHGRFPDIRSAANAEEQIDWWDEYEPDAVVCTECFAAVELHGHLERMFATAAEPPHLRLASDLDAGDSECFIMIGGAATNRAVRSLENELGYSVSAAASGDDGYRTASLRTGTTRCIVLSGESRTGTLYAVYAFLEKLGFRWLAPDEYGTVVPNGEAPALFADRDESDKPAFITRGVYTEFADDSNDQLIDWVARNRCNYAFFHRIHYPHRLKKRGIRIGGGGHNLLHRFMNPRAEYPYAHPVFGNEGPADPYPVSEQYAGDLNGDGKLSMSEAHPEWFAWINGKRSFRSAPNPEVEGTYWGDNYCTTNEEATEELCSRVVQDLISGVWKHLDYLDVWLYDNGKWCECDRCKQNGNYTYRMAMLIYRLRKRLATAMEEGRLKRNVKLIFAAYHECLDPPSRPLPADFDYKNCLVTFFPIERCYVHTFDDSVCTETNDKLHKLYSAWTEGANRTYQGEMLIGEYYNVSSFASMPCVIGEIMSRDFAYYYRSGARHFHYMHIPVKRWGMLAWNNSLYARLMWNPEEKLEEWKRQFLDDYYGPASAHMRQCYDVLEQASANMKYWKHYQEKGGVIRSLMHDIHTGKDFFPFLHLKYDRVENDPNAGPSFRDIIQLYAEARMLLHRAMGALVGDGPLLSDNPAERTRLHETIVSRLIDDDMRLTYGEQMLQFYDAMIVASYFHRQGERRLARQAFRRAQMHGEALAGMTEPLLENPYYPDLKNGFVASWIWKTYNRIRDELSLTPEGE